MEKSWIWFNNAGNIRFIFSELEMKLVNGVKNVTGSYSANSGAFGVEINGMLNWYGCRERFHAATDFMKKREYFYIHKNISRNELSEFISLVEQHLDIEESEYILTNMMDISWVIASPWWVNNPMRHNFFSICLRAALNWRKGKDWKTVLYSHPYASVTREAVTRFLNGYTEYNQACPGWHAKFSVPGSKHALTISNEERNKRISKLAYYRWQKTGRPAEENWIEATREFNQAA